MELVKKLDARVVEPGNLMKYLRPAGGFLSDEVRATVRRIIQDVRERGDEALLEYTERFDKVRPDPIRVPAAEIASAKQALSRELEASFLFAIENVRRFHEAELDRPWELTGSAGVVGQRVRPLSRVGLYVPGGHGAYPSTLVMSAVPAMVAGVREIAVCAPPGQDGHVSRWVLAVAGLLGLEEVYAVGGAQAVAAMAYGTQSIPAVFKIAGPGNAYVTAAKLEVFGAVGIDAPQGPSEVVVIADETADPGHIAYDLMAQAEHLSGASAILLTPSSDLIDAVEPYLKGEPAKLITLVQVRDLGQAVSISDAYAPEHAHVLTHDAERIAGSLTAAGCIMVGDSTPVALGDYAAGPSHALPTSGTAAWASPLGTHDFTVRTNYIQHNPQSLKEIGQHVARLAHLESFENHAKSVEVRLGSRPPGGG